MEKLVFCVGVVTTCALATQTNDDDVSGGRYGIGKTVVFCDFHGIYCITGVGVTKAPFVNFSVTENSGIAKNIGYVLSITFIFVRCLRSSAAVTPVKYDCGIKQVASVLIIVKNWENSGAEKIGLVTPTPASSLHLLS